MKSCLSVILFLGFLPDGGANAASLRVDVPNGNGKEILIDLKNGHKAVDISFYDGWTSCDFDAKHYPKNSKTTELAFLKCHTKTQQQVLVSCQANEKVEIYLGDASRSNEGGGVLTLQCDSR